MYKIGDRISLVIDRNKVGVIVAVFPSETAASRYQVFHDSANIATYYEDQIQLLTESASSTMTSYSDFLGNYAVHKMKINSASTMFALNAGKIKFIPFQFRPLTRILSAERPRILIADEVGVGKTIETGLILKEYEKRDGADSVIIICPKDLTSKWRREMKNRFDEAFEILSSDRLSYCLDELEMEGCWPYECRKCIVGLEMLRREETILRLDTIQDSACFDMVVVDEAHHVINRNSKSHEVVEYFCANSDIAVFLSATPLQLGSGDLFSLLNLLLPEEFMDESVFAAMAEPNHYINGVMRSIRNTASPDWREQALDQMKQICVNEWAVRAFSNNRILSYWIERLENDPCPISDEERIACLRDFEALHTFSHVINRTKRKDIGEFTIREPITVMTEYADAERDFYSEVTAFKHASLKKRYGERTANFIMSTIERQVTSSLPAFVRLLDQFINRGLSAIDEASDDWDEDYDSTGIDVDDLDFREWAETLKKLAENLPPMDSKANKLLDIIYETVRNNDAGKLLVFSFFKHTLRYLHELISNAGVRVEVITGDTNSVDRDELRRRFRLPKEASDAIDVLLCSEVGCEGLDYEFCSRMVNYDIPWNPMKIEQRIGRIDRFGQQSPKVQIYNFITNGTVEERIFYRCYERLGIFTSTIGDLEGVLGELATDLSQTAFDMSLSNEQQTVRAQQLIDNAIRLADEQRKFETDAKNLFLLDIDANDTAVSTERYSQIRWQKELVRIFFSHKYPGSVCTDISNTELRLRMFKAEKQNMLSSLHQLKRRRKIDRNSKQLAALEQYLESEAQTITLEFDATRESGDSNPLFVSATHPFVLMALMDEQSTSTPIYTSLKTTGNDIVPAGNYIFACYEWKECGYRESTEIIAVLYDTVKKAPISLPLLKFEQLLLSAQEAGNISAPDLSILDAHIYEQQQAAKNRLLQINQDIVARKLSTLDRYYAKQIEKTQQSLETAKNGRIATMYLSRLHKLEFAWKEKQKSLNRCLCADVLVSLFASGIMEVK